MPWCVTWAELLCCCVCRKTQRPVTSVRFYTTVATSSKCVGPCTHIMVTSALPYLTLPYLTLPYLRGGCLLGRHPALRPQHGPSAHPRPEHVSGAWAADLPLTAQAYFCDTRSPLRGPPAPAPFPLTRFSARSAHAPLQSHALKHFIHRYSP